MGRIAAIDRSFRDLSIAIDDARLLGVTNEKIAKVLSKQVGGIADWRALMNNVFILTPQATKRLALVSIWNDLMHLKKLHQLEQITMQSILDNNV